jgi:hypothetical protein
MKKRCGIALFLLCFFNASGCKDQPVETGTPDPIRLSTDKNEYERSDSLKVLLANNSNVEITVGLRCSRFLEMFYHEKNDDQWSDNKWFWYMALACPTLLDTVGTTTTLEHSLPAETFRSQGTFRLVVQTYVPIDDTVLTVFSNSFRIQ